MTISVLTLVRDRREHLVNLIEGLKRQSVLPDELVIAYMQPQAHEALPETPFPVRAVHVPGRDMPLARARNHAAQAASHVGLVFLDVDCIPSTMLIESYRQALRDQDGLFLGEVVYLPAGAVEPSLDYSRLDALGRVHPARPPIPRSGVRAEPDPGSLWGLSFALDRQAYRRVGGMDETYVGYGGEETDFAWRLARARVPFYWVADARAYHQHHRLYAPPYPHFESIVRNARYFHRQWQHWCMDYWLGQFRDAGLIEWHETAEDIRVLRHPTAKDIASARLPPTALFC